MRLSVKVFYLIPILLFSIFGRINGQSDPYKILKEDLWLQVDSTLQGMKDDTSLHFIRQIVRTHCRTSYECQHTVYHYLQVSAEKDFYIPTALYIAHEIARISQNAGDLDTEAKAYIDQYRYYHALGLRRQYMDCLEQATPILEKTKNLTDLNYIQSIQIENSAEFIPLDQVLKQFNDLIDQTRDRKVDEARIRVLVNLIEFMAQIELFEDMEPYILELENIAKTVEEGERNLILIRTTLGKGAMYAGLGNYKEAVFQYLQTQELLKQKKDKWLEIYLNQNLAELEWKLGNKKLAMAFLNIAENQALNPNLFEREAENYRLKSLFAEDEGLYHEALNYYRRQLYEEQAWRDRSKGFNVQSYNLAKEKDRLISEKERQVLEIRLKNNQLRYSIMSAIFIIGMAMIISIGFWLQRKGRIELSVKNKLIEEQTAELKSLDESKSRFFANLSHELRTPLTLMLGPLDAALKSNKLDNRNFTLIKSARQNADKLLQLVGAILDLSKMEHGKLKLKEHPVKLHEFLRRGISSFESHAEREGILFLFTFHTDKEIRILLDSEKMADVINNLLSNAIRFTHPGGQITVAVEDKGHSIQIMVSDTGTGISPEDLPRIFERYYQSGESIGGSGIGLAYCKEIIHLMGGNIWVNSQVGEGSQFYVEIPKKEVLGSGENAKIVAHPAEQISNYSSISQLTLGESAEYSSIQKSHTLLIVEDNYSLRDYLNAILSPNYHIIYAIHGQDGISKLEQLAENNAKRVDLIISDVMMPVMNGFKFLEALKSSDDYRKIPVVMLTARADIQDKLRALRIGVDDYILKPFQEEELKVRIANLLSNAAKRNAELAEQNAESERPAYSAEDSIWLEDFERYVRERIADEQLTVAFLARNFAMSDSTLLRQLKRLTGITPNQYILQVRLEHARMLLEKREYNTIASLASACGYKDTRSFSRSFKRTFGKAPTKFI